MDPEGIQDNIEMQKTNVQAVNLQTNVGEQEQLQDGSPLPDQSLSPNRQTLERLIPGQNFSIAPLPIQLPLTLEEAMQFVAPIPDTFLLEHRLIFKDECCSSIEYSIFENIPSIGDLKLGGEFKKCKCSIPGCSICCAPSVSVCSCSNCLSCMRCDYEYDHFYKGPLYTLENEIIRFEHFGILSKLYVKGVLALEFHESDYNSSDMLYGACGSNYPHLLFKNTTYIDNGSIYFEPQPNDCPEHPCANIPGCCILCSWVGIKQLKRDIKIYFLSNDGNQRYCNITTRRTRNQACLKQCGISCVEFIDYPTIEIQFQNVNQIDRLGIIMAAIHHSIFNRWVHTRWYGKLYTNIPQFYYNENDF